MRTRADEIEISAEDVDKLGEFIEAELPQPLADPGDAMVVVANPLRSGMGGRMHGAKLDQPKRSCVLAHALLDEKDGTAGVELDREGNESEERRTNDEARCRHHQAQRPATGKLEARLLEVFGEDQMARREGLNGNFSGQAFVRLDTVFDDDPLHPGFEQLAEGQASTPLGERHDDSIGTNLPDDLVEMLQGAPDRRRRCGSSWRLRVVDDAHDGEPAVRVRLDLLDELPRQGAGSEDQHAVDERAARHDAVGDGSERERYAIGASTAMEKISDLVWRGDIAVFGP